MDSVAMDEELGAGERGGGRTCYPINLPTLLCALGAEESPSPPIGRSAQSNAAILAESESPNVFSMEKE